jgi:hypothetical protein
MLRKFIKKVLFLFLIPAIVLMVFIEISLRRIPNDYRYKNKWLTENASKIKILSLGASNGYFGINPEYFSKKAFNAAHISQSVNYDLFIFDKFLPEYDSLLYLILPVSPLTLSYSLEASDEYWRIKNYTIYYGCKYHPYKPEFNLAFSGNNMLSLTPRISGFYLKGTSELYCNELGYGLNYSSDKKAAQWENAGILAAKRHKKNSSGKLYDENLSCLHQIIEESNKKGILVILVSTPVWHTYLENLDSEELKFANSTFKHLVEQYNNVRYIDLLADRRFKSIDFFDPDHLDEFGAKKLTLILNDTLETLRNTEH